MTSRSFVGREIKFGSPFVLAITGCFIPLYIVKLPDGYQEYNLHLPIVCVYVCVWGGVGWVVDPNVLEWLFANGSFQVEFEVKDNYNLPPSHCLTNLSSRSVQSPMLGMGSGLL